MPNMDGLELSAKILEQDNNVKVCFVSAVEINTKAINELYPFFEHWVLHKKAN